MVKSRLIISGLLIFVGVAQFFFLMNIAAFLYPGYSVSGNYISELGIGPSAPIFNISVFLLGLFGLVSIYLLYYEGFDRVFIVLMGLASLGAMGVGLFPMNVPYLHTIFSLITFLFSSLAAIYSIRIDITVFRYIWVLLGVIALLSLVLFVIGSYLGLGKGGMERLIVYPVLIWLLGFSMNIAGGKVIKKG